MTLLLIIYFCGVCLFSFLPFEQVYPVAFSVGSLVCAGVILRKLLK